MHAVRVALALAVLSAPLAAQGTAKVPKDSLQLIVTGCLKDRILTPTNTPRVVDGDDLEVHVDRFQVSGKKPVLAEVKKHDKQEVEIVGLVRKAHLREPGIRVPGGRLIISPGRGRDRNPPTGPTERVVLLEAQSVRPRDRTCER